MGTVLTSLLPLLLLAATASPSPPALASASVTFPLPDDCPTSCGSISVVYPFGLRDGCFRPGFNLICNTSTQTPKLFLPDGTTEIAEFPRTSSDFFYDDTIYINPPSQFVDVRGGDGLSSTAREVSWTAGDNSAPHTLTRLNDLTVVGCGVRATLTDGATNKTIAGCTTTCDGEEMVDGVCGGLGCCQIKLMNNFQSYKVQVVVSDGTTQRSTANSTAVKIFVATAYKFKRQDLYDTGFLRADGLVAALSWAIPGRCDDAQKDASSYACLSDHSDCQDNAHDLDLAYFCTCSFPYNGNAYVPHGCKPKCKLGICNKLLLGLILGMAVGLVLLFLPGLVVFINRKWKKRKEKKAREQYFRQNHGLLLEQLISSNEDIGDRTRIFSLDEMKKATNDFDVALVLGRGGHGTVYKGILMDQQVVAIKKSKIEIKGEIDQFINEVAILSRITHRNIVRLFGCCLETEVPLLVYEFISNGTLSDHLHPKDGNSSLSWDDRLRIAGEAAGALAYLHSAAFISIFHRDVKSSNILLDDNLTAKVSDFGASRSIPIDETHVITAVQGTYGYLDPQYYYTGQLTEKSDVYSFGVILLELLTGRQPISTDDIAKGQNLSINFLQAVQENRHLDLMEAQVLKEGTEEELEEVAKLACQCLSKDSNARPAMREVEFILQELRRKRKQTNMTLKQNEAEESLLAQSL